MNQLNESNTLILVTNKNEEIEIAEVKSDNFEGKFREFVAKAKKNGYKLIIDKYKHISGKLQLLKALEEIRNFKINDFKELDVEGIRILKRHLEFNKKTRAEKTSLSIKRRRTEGDEIGNPNIHKHTGIASKIRVRNAIFNDRNIAAAQQIFALRRKNMNHHAISEELNKKGVKTRKGASFYAKTVERIEKRYLDLIANFNEADYALERAFKTTTSTFNTITGFKDDFTKNEQLNIIIGGAKADKCAVIFNWNYEVIIKGKENDKGVIELSLGTISEHPNLLPGKYFLKIEKKSETVYFKPFYIAKDLLEMIG